MGGFSNVNWLMCGSFWSLAMIIAGAIMTGIGVDISGTSATSATSDNALMISGIVVLAVGFIGFIVNCIISNRNCEGCSDCLNLLV